MRTKGHNTLKNAQANINDLCRDLQLVINEDANPIESLILLQLIAKAAQLRADIDMTLTAITAEKSSDELVDAIRNAESLSELKRFIGPSQEEEQRSIERLAQIDAKWQANVKAYGEDSSKWPSHALDSYNRLMAEQTEYENQYC